VEDQEEDHKRNGCTMLKETSKKPVYPGKIRKKQFKWYRQ